MNNNLKNTLFALSLLSQGVSQASPVGLLTNPAPGAPPKTYALVSAVGDSAQFVTARYATGSSAESFKRTFVKLPDQTLNHAVLRGLMAGVKQVQPNAKTVLLAVPAVDTDLMPAAERPKVVEADLLKRLQAIGAQRQAWDEIIAVTPRYKAQGFNRVADRMYGIGNYIYSLDSATVEGDKESGQLSFADATDDVRSVGAQGAAGRVRSNHWVAPFAYLRFTVFDAKTLTVLRVVDKLEARKMADPSCSALNVYRCFTHEQYGEFINDLTERTASAGVTGAAPGRVELGEAKVVPSTPATSAPAR